MEKNNLIFTKLQIEITTGKYGPSGSRFISVRTLCDLEGISFTSAYKIFNLLKEQHLLILIKQIWYITYGIAKPSSPIRNIANTNIIGLHIKEIDNPYISSLISKLKKGFEKINYELIIQTSENNPITEEKILLNFINLGVKGVINFASTYTTDILKQTYTHYPLPMVFIGRQIKGHNQDVMPSVGTDNYKTSMYLAETLIKKGYRDFYYADLATLETVENHRLMGFIEGIQRNKMATFKKRYSFQYEDTISLNFACREIIKNSKKDNPSAIFCVNDLIAVKILSALTSMSADIPNSIGVIGYDNLPICESVHPTLSSIAYSFNDISQNAIHLLLSLIKDPFIKRKHIIIQDYFIQRKSTTELSPHQ